MISKMISDDIMKYLLENKKLSPEEISKSMGTTTEHILNIMSNHECINATDFDTYLNSSGMPFWEFVIEAIPLYHLSEKIKDRVILCKELNNCIKNKKY